jgi:predicted GNAT family acetyltransferase
MLPGMTGGVRDNTALGRFELDLDGAVAYVTYRRATGVVTLLHAEVPAALNGRGYGSMLVRGTLDLLRGEAARIVPACPFIAAFIDRNPAYRDLLV